MKLTTLCYIEKDGCYLMLHRVKKQQDINRDKWIGVGGKLEGEESPEECLLREVREETGLTLTQYRFRGIVTFVLKGQQSECEQMYLFTASGFTGALTDCQEGVLEWVPKSQVPRLPIWEGDKIFLRLLAQDAGFFSLKLVYHNDILIDQSLNQY